MYLHSLNQTYFNHYKMLPPCIMVSKNCKHYYPNTHITYFFNVNLNDLQYNSWNPLNKVFGNYSIHEMMKHKNKNIFYYEEKCAQIYKNKIINMSIYDSYIFENNLHKNHNTPSNLSHLYDSGILWLNMMQNINTCKLPIIDTTTDLTFTKDKIPLIRNGILPFSSPWIAYLHYGWNDISKLFNDDYFIYSLPFCICMITFSNFIKKN